MISGDYVDGDKAGGDIDNGPKLIDIGGNYTVVRRAPGANDDVVPGSEFTACPFCGTRLAQVNSPLFCIECGKSLTRGSS
jgi:hypothetical protein